jgi:hypothetical protein
MSTTFTTRSLAGIRFEDRTPAALALLPRMDIAVFVGFAAAGPLHVPVPLESAARFLEVFGPDLPLARDPSTGATRRAYLAATIRAFFANGGRRCWVVRVADETRAERARIGLPGVLRVSAAGALQPALAAARSAGAWFDELRVRASLSVRSVGLEAVSGLDSSAAALSFRGAADRGIAAGDVIRFRSYRPEDRRWTGFAPLIGREEAASGVAQFRTGPVKWFEDASQQTDVTASAVAVTLFSASEPESGAGGECAWTPSVCAGTIVSWPERGASRARAQVALALETIAAPATLIGQWLRLTVADGVLWMFVRQAYADARFRAATVHVEGEAWRDGVTPDRALFYDSRAWVTEIVSLDLRAAIADRAPAQLTGLGFSPLHARPWAALPTDEQHFSQDGRLAPERVQSLATLVDTPRFPLATAGAAHANDWYVPLGLDALGAPGHTWHSGRTALEREGLSEFGPELFLHEALAGTGAAALANEAEFIRLGLGETMASVALRGLHAAWPIDEASLIAVPDALHRGWDRGAAPRPVEPGSAPAVSRRSAVFDDCEQRAPRTPVLSIAAPADAQGTFTLRWTHGGEPSVGFVLEQAQRPDWTDAEVLWIGAPDPGGPPGAPMEHVLRGRAAGAYYYRVCSVAPFASCSANDAKALEPRPTGAFRVEAVRQWWTRSRQASSTRDDLEDEPCAFTPFERSDWSNGVVVSTAAAPDWEERPSRTYQAATWLAVSRALARFCGARADIMALLALPGHARDDEALALQAELLSTGGRSDTREAAPPLGSRESAAFGYTALYHAWLTESDAEGALIPVPPLGAVAGTFAACSLERGAWIAPANRALSGVLALDPPIPASRRQEFLERRLNLVRNEPSGYLVLSQDTLAHDVEAGDSLVRPINVRRLLILLRRLVLRLGEPFVFEPNGENLRIRVRHTFESVLAGLQARGAFAGRTAAESYRVECNDELNPRYTSEAGRLIAQIKIAPSRPLVFLTIRLVQTGARGRVEEIL